MNARGNDCYDELTRFDIRFERWGGGGGLGGCVRLFLDTQSSEFDSRLCSYFAALGLERLGIAKA